MQKTYKGKIGFFILLMVTLGLLYFQYRNVLDLDSLVTKEKQLREYQTHHTFLTCIIVFFIYVILTGLSLPGASVMTLASGWLLGFVKGLFVVSFASTMGATFAFLMSRFFFREAMLAKWGERLKHFNQALKKEGAFYLLSLRLVLVVPYFVINIVMGLTPIKTSTYWWVSQIGMLPATAIYIYVGASLPSLEALSERGTKGILSTQLILALALLGLFPIIARKLIGLKSQDKKSNRDC